MRQIAIFLLGIILTISANAFQLWDRQAIVSPTKSGEVMIQNAFDDPIVVKITNPEGTQIFPRRVRLNPGQRQKIKVRLIGTLPREAWLSFSYAIESKKKSSGVTAQISLRIPVRLAKNAK